MSKIGIGRPFWGGHPEIRAYVEHYDVIVVIYDGTQKSLPILHTQRPDSFGTGRAYIHVEICLKDNHYETLKISKLRG